MATQKKEEKKVNPAILAAKAAIANIEKAMGNKGKPAITRFGDAVEKVSIPSISFNNKAIDEASYCGGVPQGKIVELFGPESSGKSLLSLWLMASAQKMGKMVLLIDVEQSFDPDWARRHGVDVENLFIINDMPDDQMTAENILDYAVKACASGAFGLIVLDSTAALVPQKEFDGSIGDQDYALLARIMSKACRQIMGNCGATNTTFVFINQIREKMGVTYGDNTTTPGGKALRFYSHQRINVVAAKKIVIENGGKKIVVARRSKVIFVKNKVARPFGECEIEIVFDETLLNPMVRLCEVVKSLGLVRKRNDEFRISKEFSEDGKPIETKTSTIPQLANFIVDNKLVTVLVDAAIKLADELKAKENYDDDKDRVDDIIYKIKEDPSLVIAPTLEKVLGNKMISEDTGNKPEPISKEIDEALEKEFSEDN